MSIKLLYSLRAIWAAGFTSIYRVLPSYLANTFSAMQISMIYSAYALPKLVNIPCGWLSDKIGKQKTLFFAFFFLSIITYLSTFSEGLFHYALMFFLIGLIGNFFHPTISALVTMFSKRKTEALFRLESMYQLGAVIGPIVGGFLMFQYGINAAFYSWAFLSLVCLGISALIWKKEPKIDKNIKEKQKEPKISLWKQLKENKFGFIIFLIVGSFLTGFFESVLAITVPLYATGIGYNLIEVGLIISVASIIGILGLILIAKKVEKVKKEYSMIVTTLMVGVSFLVMMYVSSLIGIMLLTGIFVIGRTGGLNIARAFLADHLEEDVRSTGMSFSDTMQYSARIIGPLFAGFLIDFYTIQSVFILVFVISLIGVALLLVYSRFSVKKTF